MHGMVSPRLERQPARSQETCGAIGQIAFHSPSAYSFVSIERACCRCSLTLVKDSDPSKLLNSFNDRMILLNEWVHGVFGIVERLRFYQDVRGMCLRNHHDSVLVRDDDIPGIDLDSVARNRDVCSCEAIVPNGSGRHGTERIDRKLYPLQLRNVPYPAIHDSPSITT